MQTPRHAVTPCAVRLLLVAVFALGSTGCLGEFDASGSTYYECDTDADCLGDYTCQQVIGAEVFVCVADGESPPSVGGGDVGDTDTAGDTVDEDTEPGDAVQEVLDDSGGAETPADTGPEDAHGDDAAHPLDVPAETVETVETAEEVSPDDAASPDATADAGDSGPDSDTTTPDGVDASCSVDADCPVGLTCQATDAGEPATFECMEPNQWLCQPCQSDAVCADGIGFGGKCQDQGADGSFCVLACTQGGDDCPASFDCTNDGSGWWCTPQAGACSCNPFGTLLGLETTCAVENDAGSCAGTRSCGTGGLSACSADTPSDETCNGVDDDCDGDTDEETDLWCAEEEGDPCTVGEACVEGGCQPGTAAECEPSAGEPCVVNTCVAAVEGVAVGFDCMPIDADDTVPCDDGLPCTEDDLCDGAGGCAGVIIDGCCQSDGDCPDGDCVEPSCSEGSCVSAPLSDVPCDDGDPCTEGDTCLDGDCQVSTAVDCPAGNDCETVSCDSAAAPGEHCVYTPKTGEPCSDGDPCTTGDTCDEAAACTPTGTLDAPACCHADAECDDGNPCTTDGCGTDDVCFYEHADGVECDDGTPCTEDDTCLGGECAASTDFPCIEGDDCNLVECVVGAGGAPECVVTKLNNTVCDDGNPCTIFDTCLDGTCTPAGQEPACCVDDADPACDDGDPCTDDSCDEANNACLHDPNTGAGCDADGDGCTVDDACIAGECTAGATAECDAVECHDVTCVSQGAGSFACVATPAAGTACDDADPCTDADTCDDQGACIPGEPIPAPACCHEDADCDDGNPCTDDACEDDSCVSAPQSIACDADGNGCTMDDFCDEQGGCVAGDPATCPDGDACHVGICVHDGDQADGNGFFCDTEPVSGVPCDTGDDCLEGLCSVGACEPSQAQTWQHETSGNSDVVATGLAVRADGSVLWVGWSDNGGQDGLEGRHTLLDPLGEPVWNRTLGEDDSDDVFVDAAALSDGGFLLAGNRGAAADVWVTRLDDNGDEGSAWPRYYGSTTESDRAFAVALDEAGDAFVLIGERSAGPVKLADGALTRVALTSGGLDWTKTYGDSGEDRLHDGVFVDGDIVAVGSTTSMGAGGVDGWMVRVSAVSGAQDLGVALGSAGTDSLAAVTAHDGGVVAVGTREVNGSERLWLVSLTKSGSVRWERTLAASVDTRGVALDATADGGLAVLAQTGEGMGSNVTLHRFSGGGISVWDRSYGANEPNVATAIAGIPGGGYAIATNRAENTDEPLEVRALRVNHWGHTECQTGSACNALSAADCPGGEGCQSGFCDVAAGCVTTGADSCDDDNECTQESCDADSGECEFSNVADGTACTSFDGCGTGSCQDGACVADNPSACLPPGQLCTPGDCSVPNGDPCKVAECSEIGCVVENRQYHREDLFGPLAGEALGIMQHPTEGGHLLVGSLAGDGGNSDAFIRRLDGEGQDVWSVVLDGAPESRLNDVTTELSEPGATRRFYAGGSVDGEALVVSFDSSGAVRWALAYLEADEVVSVTERLDAPGVLVAGWSDLGGIEAWWVAAIDDNGNLDWELVEEPDTSGRIEAVSWVDFTGEYIVTGTFDGEIRTRTIDLAGAWGPTDVTDGPGSGMSLSSAHGPMPGVAVAGYRLLPDDSRTPVFFRLTQDPTGEGGPFGALVKQFDFDLPIVSDAGFESVMQTFQDLGVVAVTNSGGISAIHKFDFDGYRMWEREPELPAAPYRIAAITQGLGNGIAAAGTEQGRPWGARFTNWGHQLCSASGEPCGTKDTFQCGNMNSCLVVDCVRDGGAPGCVPTVDPPQYPPLPVYVDGLGPCDPQ